MKPIMPIVKIGVVAVLLAGAVYAGSVYTRKTASQSEQKLKPFSSVFLTNGQVYFGNVEKKTKDEIVLSDIYYLQVQQPIQPQPEQKDAKQEQPQVSLVKLGKEIHGPKDRMTINMSQVTFIEEITEDGQVMQTIKKYKSGEIKPDGSAAEQPATPTTETKTETKK